MEKQLQTVFGGDTDCLFSIIRELNEENAFKKIYVSIGSKINEKSVTFNNPKLLDRRTNQPILPKSSTNAFCQMIPEFLLSDSNNRILVLVIDQFSNDSNYEINHALIDRSLSESESNVNVILFDQLFSIYTLENFLTRLTKFVSENSISEKNLLICNYVKFLNNPNVTESESETMIPETIQSLLDKHESGRYAYCFYEWFGYHFYLYNFIYNYKRIAHLPNISILRDDLTQFIKNRYIDCIFLEKNYNQKIRFLDNIYDITLPVSIEQGFTTSLKEYLIENGEL
jgi:hypothetical protein